ncbi:MAG: DUF423 domain-containing protein [Candidatus Lambdaproteobacteria bacterium]|nr:DUF423 domain-containing protein [Candidatus Lambdaproteobacteria bacterium]
MSRRWLLTVGLLGLAGVALGAFGAHGLRAILPLQKIAIYETAVRYHLFHVLALLAVVLLMERLPAQARALQRVAGLFLAGIVLFSGSLYAFALRDWGMAVWITPVGGLAWLAAWGGLAWVAWRLPRAQ